MCADSFVNVDLLNLDG